MNPENAAAAESLIMNEYKKLVGDWDYFVIRLRVGIKVFEDMIYDMSDFSIYSINKVFITIFFLVNIF